MSAGLTGNGIPVGIGYDSNGDPKGFVEIASVGITHTDVTADYTIIEGDRLLYVSSASPVTISLPAVTSNTYRVIDIHNSGTSTITVDGNGSETINGSTTILLGTQYDSITLHCNGTTWRII